MSRMTFARFIILMSIIYLVSFINKLVTWHCGRQLDKHGQKKDDGPGIKGHEDGKLGVPSNGQNEENKDLAPRVICVPPAYCWPCGLNSLTSHISGHALWTLS